MDELAQCRLAGMKLPYRTLIKTPDEVAQERANRPPPPPDPNLIKAQADMLKAQNDQKRLELDAHRGMAEDQLKFQEAQLKAQAQIRTDEIRAQEAQASVIKAQYDFNAQMAALAAKSEGERDRILADIHNSELDRQTQLFLGGMNARIKMNDQALSKQELDFKKESGKSGVTSIK